MKRKLLLLTIIIALTFGLSLESMAQRRGVVVRNRPHRTTLVIRTGHPIRRRLPATVVVRPPHRFVAVAAPLVFLPALRWTAPVVALPVRERLAWRDSEVIGSDEAWVDTNFGIDSSGNAIFLEVVGKAELNFAEVTFADGNVQVVDFNEETHGAGIYKLLDFADGRHVKTVRILVLSKTADTRMTVYLST